MTPVSFEVSLFGDPRIEARLPAPRGLSQVTTSFIGSWCLGIHRSHLVACQKNLSTLQRCSRPLCSSQNTGDTTNNNQPKAGHHPSGSTEGVAKATDPSEPQQRALTNPPTTTTFHSPKGCTRTHDLPASLTVNVPHSRATLANNECAGTR